MQNYSVTSVTDPEGLFDTAYRALTTSLLPTHQRLVVAAVDVFRPGFKFGPLSLSTYSEFCAKDEKAKTNPLFPQPERGGERFLTLGEAAAKAYLFRDYRGSGLHSYSSAGAFIKAYENTSGLHTLAQKLGQPMSPKIYDILDLARGFLLLSNLGLNGQRAGIEIVNRDDLVFCGTPQELSVVRSDTAFLKQKFAAADALPR